MSTATSPHDRSVAGTNALRDSEKSSPKRKKPKKAVHATAHITTFFGLEESNRAVFIFPSIRTVIGSLILPGVPFRSLILLIPACTLLKTGIEECSLGSGRPREICMLLRAERYDFPVCGASP